MKRKTKKMVKRSRRTGKRRSKGRAIKESHKEKALRLAKELDEVLKKC